MSTKPWTTLNCYETLGVAADATAAEIRRAFKAASRRAHPDRGGSHEAQVKVNLAYEILSNPESRTRHDHHWTPPATSAAAAPGMPFFSDASAIQNLWKGPGSGAQRLSDGKGSSGLAARIKQRIERDRDRITLDRENRREIVQKQFSQDLQQRRLEALVLLGVVLASGVVGTLFPVSLLVGGVCLWPLALRLKGVSLEHGQRVPLLDPRAPRRLSDEAERLSQLSVERDRERLEVHFAALEAVSRLILTPTKPTDSDGLVLRRLLATLFVLGYLPMRHEPAQQRVFLEGEMGSAVLYFRHGTNASLAVTSVEKVLASRPALGNPTVFLYNQGGLSKRAAEVADDAGVRWLGLKELNAWVRQVWVSESNGPSGDILQRLVELSAFLEHLPA